MSRVALIVDDFPEHVRTLAAILKSHGLTCREAADMMEAKTRLSEGGIDFCVLDLGIPSEEGEMSRRENGIILLKWMRDKLAMEHMPVIVVTGEDRQSTEFAAEVMTIGDSKVTQYLTKPIIAERVDQKVQWALAVCQQAEAEPVVTAKPAEKPKLTTMNWFRPAGETWYVMRNGNGPHGIKHVIGMQILHWLLQQPNRPLSCRDIAHRLSRETSSLFKRADAQPYADAVEEIDADDGEATSHTAQPGASEKKNERGLEMHLDMVSKDDLAIIAKQIREREEALEDNPSPKRRQVLQEEIAQLEAYRNRATMPGRPQTAKKVNPAQTRLLKSLKNAVETAIRLIEAYDPLLATYLNTPAKGGTIATGYLMVYRPPLDAGEWDLRSTSLQDMIRNATA